MIMPASRRTAVIALAALCAAAFGLGGFVEPGTPVTSPAPPPPPPSNSPAISGAPPTTVVAGQAYSFQPSASGPQGVTLTFSISNRPGWAAFDPSIGSLSGTPPSTAVGTYSNIVISVNAGAATASLPTFAIQVLAPPPADNSTTLSAEYPGDVGMDADPSVVWHEAFAEASVSALAARYSDVRNPAGMALISDVPANSSGQHALQLVAGGGTPATHLYTNFSAGYDELWYRYYVKYVGAGPWHHSGLWFGGYNPSIGYPYPQAGLRPTGTDRFSVALEPMESTTNPMMDFYAYWMQMHSWMANPSGDTAYYGNTFIHSNEFTVTSDVWTCFEVHLKLNPDPTTGAGAVLEAWKNDSLVVRFDDTSPLGYWTADKFCPSTADASACVDYRPSNPASEVLDQRWRSTAALQINNIWLENYNTAAGTSTMLYDDLVVATRRVGCTVKK
jgi:Putative Ig domain